MRSTRAGRLLAATCMAGLALLATGCSGGDDEKPSSSSSSPAPLQTTASLGKVAGSLPTSQSDPIVSAVADVVDGWIDAAFVGGDYPRTDFTGSFPGFTPGAAKDAQADLTLMSNADIGGQIDSVTATKRLVKVDILAPDGKPAGATARVRLVFVTAGDLEQKVTVTGQLRLTQEGGSWQVFGYDVAKGMQ